MTPAIKRGLLFSKILTMQGYLSYSLGPWLLKSILFNGQYLAGGVYFIGVKTKDQPVIKRFVEG